MNEVPGRSPMYSHFDYCRERIKGRLDQQGSTGDIEPLRRYRHENISASKNRGRPSRKTPMAGCVRSEKNRIIISVEDSIPPERLSFLGSGVSKIKYRAGHGGFISACPRLMIIAFEIGEQLEVRQDLVGCIVLGGCVIPLLLILPASAFLICVVHGLALKLSENFTSYQVNAARARSLSLAIARMCRLN